MKGSIVENIKIGKHLHNEFLQLADEAEKRRSFELLAKGSTLKGKLQEKQGEASRLEEALQVLHEQRKNIM